MIGDPFISEEAYTFKGGKTDRCGRTSYFNTGHCSDAGGCVAGNTTDLADCACGSVGSKT
jgi:uncharacterized Fe-S cluster protein YjdI